MAALSRSAATVDGFSSTRIEEGVTVMEKVETYDYGKFGWIVDLEGNKIELWQPLNEEEQFKKK